MFPCATHGWHCRPTPGLTGESPTVEGFYENAPEAYRDKLDQELLITLPACRGDTYTDCKGKLEARV